MVSLTNHDMSQHGLILASASPQRKQLLAGLNVDFEVIPSPFDESSYPEQDPEKRAQELAFKKAEAVASDHGDACVIGCDTLVVAADGSLLEKPADATEARAMIRKLSGNTCTVHSGVCVIAPGGTALDGLSSSAVTFTSLSDSEVDWWIGTELWQGRSGSFQIDGPGQLMIEKIDGDWTGVVGLPVFLLGQLLTKLGYDLQRR